MGFNKTLLALAIPLAMVGCGGSSGGSDNDKTSTDDDTSGQPTTAETISFSGRVADGYLSNATVCIDINENKKCDDSDPSATSIAGGKFTIDDATQAQRDKFPLLVEIKVGETIDEDNEGITLNKPLTLAAPAGYDFISPLSTMVQNNVEAGVSKEDAEKIVQSKLDTKLDLNTDYVAGKDSADNANEYARLHQVAQVTARVISGNMDTLSDAAEENDISIDYLIKAIVDEVFDALEEITFQVKETTKNTHSEFNPDTLSETIDSDLIDIDENNINYLVNKNEAQAAATSVDMSRILLGDGLAYFEIETDLTGKLEIDYGIIPNGSDYEWISDTEGFSIIPPEYQDDDESYVLNDSGSWIKVDNYWAGEVIIGGTDGTITITRGNTEVSVREVYNTTEVDLTDLNIRTIMNEVDSSGGIWGEYMDATATFPIGSKGYTFQPANIENNSHYLFEGFTDCGMSNPQLSDLCNFSYVQNSPTANNGYATSFENIIVDSAYVPSGIEATDILGITAVEIAYSSSHKLWAEIVKNNTVNYYKVGQDHNTPSINFLGASTWAAVSGSDVALELQWIESLQEFNAYESGENNPVLALIGNYVRNAEHRGANPQPTSRARLLLLNSTATAVATTGFSTENLDD